MAVTQRSAGDDGAATSALVVQMCRTLAKLQTPNRIHRFLGDLLTGPELISFAKRLETVRLLAEGVTFSEIQRRIGVAAATIARANRILHSGSAGDGFRLALRFGRTTRLMRRRAARSGVEGTRRRPTG